MPKQPSKPTITKVTTDLHLAVGLIVGMIGAFLVGVVLLMSMSSVSSIRESAPQAPLTSTYVCGDVDNDGIVSVADLTYLIGYLFQSGPEPQYMEAADADGTGNVDVGDLTYLVAYLWQGGSEPVCEQSITYTDCSEVPPGVLNGRQCEPVSSCPMALNQDNTFYLLTDNSTASGTCFVMNATNVVLDLNGKTVTFGSNGAANNYGIEFMSSADVEIRNGSIVHGSTGQQSAIIYTTDGIYDGIDIHHIYGEIYGLDSQGIISVHDKNVSIHDNELKLDIQISNRHQIKSAIAIGHFEEGYARVERNKVYGNGQAAIQIGTDKNYYTWAKIADNELRLNGIAANSYQIVVSGIGYPVDADYLVPPDVPKDCDYPVAPFDPEDASNPIPLIIYNNIIETPELVAGEFGSRGIVFEGIDGGSRQGIDGAIVSYNTINVMELGDREAQERGLTHAIRARTPDGIQGPEQNILFNNEFYRNIITATGDYRAADDRGDAYAVRITLNAPIPAGDENVFGWNTITANALDSRVRAYAVQIYGHNTADEGGTIFCNNTITSNYSPISFAWGGGSGVYFDSNEIYIGPNPTKFRTLIFNNANEGSAINNIFLNNTLGPGVDLMDLWQWPGDESDNPGLRDFFVTWYLDVTVHDAGVPVDGALVKIEDTNSNQVFSGITEDGTVRAELTEYHYNVLTETMDDNYNPYTVTATDGPASDSVQVTMDESKAVTISL